MLRRSAVAVIFCVATLVASSASADPIYNNLTPNNAMAMATRPDAGGRPEIEAADDFFLSASSRIQSASFIGLVVPGSATSNIGQVVVEIYRVFPKDSDPVRAPQVLTRANSPSDVAFDSRDSALGQLTLTTTLLTPSFTANNSVLNGINKFPNQTTGGEGSVTGQEIQFNVTFTTPFSLPSDHYFFVPQVEVTGGEFYWLSALRPVSFPPNVTDLQTWIRNAALDPDWSRVGTDIVGGATPPTFNAAFSLDGTVPEPSTVVLVGSAIIGFAVHIARRRRVTK